MPDSIVCWPKIELVGGPMDGQVNRRDFHFSTTSPDVDLSLFKGALLFTTDRRGVNHWRWPVYRRRGAGPKYDFDRYETEPVRAVERKAGEVPDPD